MAYGTRCNRCGWQEVDHHPSGECSDDQDPTKIRPGGFKFSLDKCRGFVSNDPETELDMALSVIREHLQESPTDGQDFEDAFLAVSDLPSDFLHDACARMRKVFEARLKRKKKEDQKS